MRRRQQPRRCLEAALILCLLATVVVVGGCKSKPAAFAVYIGADEPSARFASEVFYPRRDRTIYCEEQPIVSDEHLARAWHKSAEEVGIELTAAGQSIMEREADRYLERHLVIVLDNEVLGAPVATSRLSNLGLYAAFMSDPSEEKLNGIVLRLNNLAGAPPK